MRKTARCNCNAAPIASCWSSRAAREIGEESTTASEPVALALARERPITGPVVVPFNLNGDCSAEFVVDAMIGTRAFGSRIVPFFPAEVGIIRRKYDGK